MLAAMAGDHEAELRLALAEGLLSKEEAERLRDEARRKGQSPLELLVALGRLSEDSLVSLRGAATARDRDPHETVDPLGATSPNDGESDDPPVFPVTGWDRYQHVRFLGQGGMGRVFLARDPRLRRDVALKFVRGDDPEVARRFVTEARAQARVNHDRICKVYEVGEVQGKVFIAMQYIDGRPLSALAEELNVEQKVMVIRDAALAIHEAHHAGLIHRDIKPSNIMVERAGDGDVKPYVMDFGLARDWSDNATVTGTVLGTPHYMAPEQARGETGTLDRRADVYSLGASLYHVLLGQPPIPGSNSLEVLSNIAHVEPIAPRSLRPDIPKDLEAIVLQCLEKDRAARYESARALASDLERFLCGDPVHARAFGVGYRLRKKLAKHRRIAVLAGLALVLICGALGWGIMGRREAKERERLATRFTEMVERIEAMARYSDLSPLHDVGADRKAMREKMAELEAEIRGAGDVAMGPGHYALGRGYLAQGDEQKAKEYLESAWNHGFREPRVAYALALVLGHLYRQRLLEVERTENREQREAKRREIERLYRDPALDFLKHSEGAGVPSSEYVAALVAFYEGHLDQALHDLDAAGSGLPPWFYELPELRGDIFMVRAFKSWSEGRRDAALADFEAGRRAYAAACAVGESVASVHAGLAELEDAAMFMQLYDEGDVTPHFDRGMEAVSRALAANPDRYESLVLEARLHRHLVEYRLNHGGAVEELVRKGIAVAERAIAVAPSRSEARLELGRSYWQWGQDHQNRNQDPSGELRKAVEIFESIEPADRDYEFHTHLGLIFATWADYEDQVGRDSTENRGKAIDSYRTAIRIDARVPEAWMNLGIAYFTSASQPRSKDPDADLREASDAIEEARKRNDKHVVPYFYGGQIHALMASRKRARGGDAQPDVDAALHLYRQGLAINPGVPQLHNGEGSILLDSAGDAWDRGDDPDPILDLARAAYEQAVTVAPEQGFGYHNVGEALARRARYRFARGDDPTPAASAAMTAIQKAIDRLPEHAPPWANLGMVHAIVAAYELEAGRDPGKSVEKAAAALSRALSKNPKDAQSNLYLGQIRGIRARFEASKGRGRPADFDEAAQAFQKAIELAPDRQDYRIAFGHFCLEWAAWQRSMGRNAGPTLSLGFDQVSEVTKLRPDWGEVRILHAALLAARAESLPSGKDRARAALEFKKAFEVNRNLERVWRSRAAAAAAQNDDVSGSASPP